MAASNLRLAHSLTSKGYYKDAQIYLDSARKLLWELSKETEATRYMTKENKETLEKYLTKEAG